MILDVLKKLIYVYGYVRKTRARKNRLTGKVEFVLWKAGEQGHKKDYWHKFGAGHEKNFISDSNKMRIIHD